jgi:hypothetical protein
MINEDSTVLKEEYIETMGPDFDKGLDLIIHAWLKWKNGPATVKSDIAPARKELVKYINKSLS